METCFHQGIKSKKGHCDSHNYFSPSQFQVYISQFYPFFSQKSENCEIQTQNCETKTHHSDKNGPNDFIFFENRVLQCKIRIERRKFCLFSEKKKKSEMWDKLQLYTHIHTHIYFFIILFLFLFFLWQKKVNLCKKKNSAFFPQICLFSVRKVRIVKHKL